MNEILRLKKLDERKQQIALNNGKPESRLESKSTNRFAGKILGNKNNFSRLKIEHVEKLEQHCQRLIYEKEERVVENESTLKQEDQQIQDLENEIRVLEQQMKEKQQENNLMDFKLRDLARNETV